MLWNNLDLHFDALGWKQKRIPIQYGMLLSCGARNNKKVNRCESGFLLLSLFPIIAGSSVLDPPPLILKPLCCRPLVGSPYSSYYLLPFSLYFAFIKCIFLFHTFGPFVLSSLPLRSSSLVYSSRATHQTFVLYGMAWRQALSWRTYLIRYSFEPTLTRRYAVERSRFISAGLYIHYFLIPQSMDSGAQNQGAGN